MYNPKYSISHCRFSTKMGTYIKKIFVFLYNNLLAYVKTVLFKNKKINFFNWSYYSLK